MIYWVKKLWITFLLILLSSCAFFSLPPASTIPYTKPTNINNVFNISGRFVIKTSTKNNYGNFTWNKESSESEDIEFRTPLGQTVATITIDESGVAILKTQNESYIGDDLTDEMQDRFGFTLPIQSLHYWVQGIAIPNDPVDKMLNDGFIQDGWHIEYVEWADKNHPHIVRCTNGALEIKLLIDWN